MADKQPNWQTLTAVIEKRIAEIEESQRIRQETIDMAPNERLAPWTSKLTGGSRNINCTHHQLSGEKTALQRRLSEIETGKFTGLCYKCGFEIGLDRLLAVPTTSTCIKCQSGIQRERDEMDGERNLRPRI